MNSARTVLLVFFLACFTGSCAAVRPLSLLKMGMFSKKQHCDANGTPAAEGGDDAHASACLGDFPPQQSYWEGGSSYLLLGSGIRYFKLGFISVKVSRTVCLSYLLDTTQTFISLRLLTRVASSLSSPHNGGCRVVCVPHGSSTGVPTGQKCSPHIKYSI